MMDRTTLFILLILDIFVMGGSAYVIHSRLKDAKEPAPIAAMDPAASLPATAQPQGMEEQAMPEETLGAPAPASKIRPQAKSAKQLPKKVSFHYRDAVSKQVSITGEFSQWKPRPMKRGKNAAWTAVLNLAPGKYAYNFLVDGKMIRDPSNRQSVNAGQKIKSSLLTVKPK